MSQRDLKFCEKGYHHDANMWVSLSKKIQRKSYYIPNTKKKITIICSVKHILSLTKKNIKKAIFCVVLTVVYSKRE